MQGRAAMAWLLFMACSPTGTNTPDGETLATCVSGWWERAAGACDCTDKPECAAADCVRTRVRRFDANGTFTEGYLLRSESLATTSTATPLVDGTWTMPDDTHVLMNGTGDAVKANCTSTRLTLASFVDTRVDASLSASLDSNLETFGRSWSAAPTGN